MHINGACRDLSLKLSIVFILPQNISSRFRREASVRNLLERHLQLDNSSEDDEDDVTDSTLTRETFLLEKLKLPREWLHSAKAVRARAEGRRHEEAWHLLRARQWNECHKVVVKHVAAEMIIHGNLNLFLFASLRLYSVLFAHIPI